MPATVGLGLEVVGGEDPFDDGRRTGRVGNLGAGPRRGRLPLQAPGDLVGRLRVLLVQTREQSGCPFRKRWHLVADGSQKIVRRQCREHEVLAGPLLEFCIERVAAVAEDLEKPRLDLGEQVDELDKGREDDSLGAGRAGLHLRLQRQELLDRTAAATFGNQMAKLSEHVSSDLHQRLVALVVLDILQDVPRRVLLELVVVGDDLDDSLPHLVADVLAGHGDQSQRDVHVPLHVDGELLRQDRELQHHLLADGVVGALQILEELRDDGPRVRDVAHAVQQIQALAAHADVAISKGREDDALVPFNWVERLCRCCEVRHGLQAQVPDVGLFRLDEPAQPGRYLDYEISLGVEVDDEVDCFEEDSVLGVVLLHVLRHLHCQVQYSAERLSDEVAYISITCRALQHSSLIQRPPQPLGAVLEGG